MKKYLLVSLLALGGLTSCQQEQSVEQISNETFGFNAVVEGAVTRSGSKTLDIISLCADTEKAFSAFDLNNDKRSWKDYAQKNVKFYAHYPQLPSNEDIDAERIISGGTEYLFGDVQANYGESTITLNFKRANVQIFVKVLNEDGTYTAINNAKLKIKNKGKQNLKTGAISVIESISSEQVTLESSEEGEVSGYILPQEIAAGTVLTAELASGEQQTATLTRSMSLSSNNSYEIILDKGKVEISILDPVIPL